MLPSANASGEEQKPQQSWQGEAVEPHHKCPTSLHRICKLCAPGVGIGRSGRGRRVPCSSLSTIVLQTSRGFLVLAALISSSLVLATRIPDFEESGMARGESCRPRHKIFTSALKSMNFKQSSWARLLLRPQLASLQANCWQGLLTQRNSMGYS